jgi:SRSO17 transposase
MTYAQYGYPARRPFVDEISLMCQQMFSSLPRSDQRRWAEVYVRGLLSVPGRKTVRRISDAVTGGGAEQCLQQFVNQSTWRSDLIRRDVTLLLTEAMDPTYWVIDDVVIPKSGNHSVAVDKQFAPPEGRALNCQLGLGLFLSGDGWSCPVNWRLPLPASWEGDMVRRRKAHIPETENCKPRWQHMIDVIDEVATEWMVPTRPVIGDLSAEPNVDRVLHDLDERRLRYAVKVAVNRPALRMPGTAREMTFLQVISQAIRRNATAVNGWQVASRRSSLIRIIAVPLPSPLPRSAAQRYLVAEWSTVRDAPRSAWVTSFPLRDIPRLLEGTTRCSQVRSEMSVLYDDLGLRHFEGRSFIGWHHYATLVSVANACRLLCRPDPGGRLDLEPQAWLPEPPTHAGVLVAAGR